MSRIKRVLLVFVAAVTVAVLGVATPAHASADQCHNDPYAHLGNVCFWKDINFQGQFIEWVEEANYTCWNVPSSWNDIATSGYNRTWTKRVQLFVNANCNTLFWTMNAQTGVGYFSGHNDQLTSFKFIPNGSLVEPATYLAYTIGSSAPPLTCSSTTHVCK